MAESQTRLQVEIVAYCADCEKDLAESAVKYLGVRFSCPTDPTHLASVVQGIEGRRWLWLESKLLRYQSRWSLSHLLGLEHYAEYIIIGIIIAFIGALLVAFYLPKTTNCGLSWNFMMMLPVLYLVLDIVAVNTSIAFTTRSPTNPLRTAILTLLAFFSVALAFSVLFALMPYCFKPPLNHPVNAAYFSFITITTTGYGDIKPLSKEWLPQFAIIVEIIISVYFLVILLAIISNWTNNRSLYLDIKSLDDVRIINPSVGNGTFSHGFERIFEIVRSFICTKLNNQPPKQ